MTQRGVNDFVEIVKRLVFFEFGNERDGRAAFLDEPPGCRNIPGVPNKGERNVINSDSLQRFTHQPSSGNLNRGTKRCQG
jgi:hypothetical protein